MPICARNWPSSTSIQPRAHPAEFAALIKLETKKWADVIKRAKITVD